MKYLAEILSMCKIAVSRWFFLSFSCWNYCSWNKRLLISLCDDKVLLDYHFYNIIAVFKMRKINRNGNIITNQKICIIIIKCSTSPTANSKILFWTRIFKFFHAVDDTGHSSIPCFINYTDYFHLAFVCAYKIRLAFATMHFGWNFRSFINWRFSNHRNITNTTLWLESNTCDTPMKYFNIESNIDYNFSNRITTFKHVNV